MLALIWLIASAHAVEVVVQYQPPTGQNAFVRFTDVDPGVERTVDVPCGLAPACRVHMTATPVGEKWQLSVRVDEIRRSMFGVEHMKLVVQPTFEVPADQVASFFSGGHGAVPGTSPVVWWEQGVHVQAFVEPGTSVAESK